MRNRVFFFHLRQHQLPLRAAPFFHPPRATRRQPLVHFVFLQPQQIFPPSFPDSDRAEKLRGDFVYCRTPNCPVRSLNSRAANFGDYFLFFKRRHGPGDSLFAESGFLHHFLLPVRKFAGIIIRCRERGAHHNRHSFAPRRMRQPRQIHHPPSPRFARAHGKKY